MATNVIILGAGELGMAMLHALSSAAPFGTKISVLLRSSPTPMSPEKAAQYSAITNLKVTRVPGDVANSTITELAVIFKPYDLVISCLGFASGPGSQLKIAQAVLAAGVKRYFPWQFGVDYDVIGRGSAQTLFDEQLDVRDLLRGQSGTEWVIVSTGMFTSFLFEGYFGVVDLEAEDGRGVVRALGSWENKVTVTTPDDIGTLTARIVFAEPAFRNEVVYTAGETIEYGTLADLVDELLGRTVVREVWTVEGLKRELAKDPKNPVKKYRVVFAEGRGCYWDKEDTFNAKKGIEVQDVRDWTQKNLRK
ncbi:isoflavone reductase [Hyphodiscus hymeniophilus]|uniref:Isoflavone reductase n=1 Tax=Hyphodiscus hymeniophilus TaxID=353542 RepID=A0A9P6VPU4_9HELO|nr:isoflavone reductase [Hyphodiscus hymeniophilus]